MSMYLVNRGDVNNVSEKHFIVNHYPNFAQFLKTLVDENTTTEATKKYLYAWFYGKIWDDTFEYNESNKPAPYEDQKFFITPPRYGHDFKLRERNREIEEEVARRELLSEITELLQVAIKKAIDKNCPLTRNLDTKFVHDILQNITIKWALKASYEDMKKFVQRRVTENGKKTDSLYHVIQYYDRQSKRNTLIEHLFQDTTCDWFFARVPQVQLENDQELKQFFQEAKNNQINLIFLRMQQCVKNPDDIELKQKLTKDMQSFYDTQYRHRVDKRITDIAVEVLLYEMEQKTVLQANIEEKMRSLYCEYKKI